MAQIEVFEPVPFKVPDYSNEFKEVQKSANNTKLDDFFGGLLYGTETTSPDDFTYGLPPQTAKKLHERLVDGFNWSHWTEKIRGMGNHYTVEIQGIEEPGEDSFIHFVHSNSQNPDAIPILLMHGWPGSFLEFEEIIPLLKSDYHVVIPSMTGYPFSSRQKARAPNSILPKWTISAFTTACHLIMQKLGYVRYVAQGGDTGHLVVRRLAQLFPSHCVAIHLNNAAHLGSSDPGPLMAPDQSFEDLSIDEKRGIERWQEFQTKGTAYFRMHGTVPYTVAAVLSTSPLAFIFWISEKLYRWSSPNTAPSLDFALATCLLYWFSGAMPSCIWHYFLITNNSEDMETIFRESTKVPAAIGIGKYEFGWQSQRAFELVFLELRSWRILDEGGHFAAHEVPELLKADFDKLFQSKEVLKALRGG